MNLPSSSQRNYISGRTALSITAKTAPEDSIGPRQNYNLFPSDSRMDGISILFIAAYKRKNRSIVTIVNSRKSLRLFSRKSPFISFIVPFLYFVEVFLARSVRVPPHSRYRKQVTR